MNETLKHYVCEICGGELKEIDEGHFQCPYCRAEFFKETTLPDELMLDLHSANRARSLQRFEDALNEYDRIIASYPDSFDAYWGATLSDYGIQYEKDYDGRMIPTVHRFSETPVSENRYYISAVAYCKSEKEKARIEKSAAEIERIRADIKKSVGAQEPYDIFLCYKETPTNGNALYTPEFKWANDLYIELSNLGYRVFFAKESLPASRGDYEAHIFPALRSAKLMLILTTSVENAESVWVKNEWSRFIRFSRENPSEGKRFKVIYRDVRPEELPRELRKEQALDHDSNRWHEALLEVIKDTFRDREKEEEERRKREAKELEERISKLSEERIRELEKKLAEEKQRQANDAARSESVSQSLVAYVEKQYDIGFYKGYVLGDIPNGNGKMTYAGGDTYDGQWKDGKKHGDGKYSWSNGSFYDGQWQNDMRSGIGKFTSNNGNVYEGEFKEGVACGKGKFIAANGNVYEGDFKNDVANGKGKLTAANGSVYEGDFENDIANGKGKMTYANGEVYDGEWKDNIANGKGKMTYANGDVYDGEWKDGKKNGKGKFIFKNGDIYDGEWKDDRRDGKGKIIYANGNIYDGEWRDDRFNGNGKYTWPGGSVFEGEWQDGNFNGVGKLSTHDGEIVEGEWEKGIFKGNYKVTVRLKYSSSPFSPATGSTYLVKFGEKRSVKIISGKTDVTETFVLPGGSHTVSVDIHAYNDKDCTKKPVWTSKEHSFDLEANVPVTITITPGKILTSPKIDIAYK